MRDCIKYPRTYHLPWSLGVQDDDKVLHDLSVLMNSEIVVTEKLDGENTSIYRNHIHARSIDGRHHPSRDWVKTFASTFQHEIPEGWRVCGENVYAKHSIEYHDLETYFYGFSVWNERNECLSWDETLEWFELLGIIPVPVLYRGNWEECSLKSLWSECKGAKSEGYVVRVAETFEYSKFARSVAKFVRDNHVQTDIHWMNAEIIANKLR